MIVVWCLLGFIAGLITAYIHIVKSRKVGTLRVDRSDPDDEPYMFLELKSGPYEIAYKRFVILDVKSEDYISHE